MGYCGLDARRAPLSGLEVRGCWEALSIGETPGDDGAVGRLVPVGPGRVPRREFVPVEDLVATAPGTAEPEPAGSAGGTRAATGVGATLFGDPEA